jgi:hypothetical protein
MQSPFLHLSATNSTHYDLTIPFTSKLIAGYSVYTHFTTKNRQLFSIRYTMKNKPDVCLPQTQNLTLTITHTHTPTPTPTPKNSQHVKIEYVTVTYLLLLDSNFHPIKINISSDFCCLVHSCYTLCYFNTSNFDFDPPVLRYNKVRIAYRFVSFPISFPRFRL